MSAHKRYTMKAYVEGEEIPNSSLIS